MRVVILGPSFRSYLESVARGFEQHGIAATTLSYPEPPIGVLQIVAHDLLPRRNITFLRRRLIDRVVRQAEAASRGAQLLVLVKSDAIPLAQYEALLQSVKCPKILWFMDSLQYIKEGLERAGMAEGVFYFEGTDSSALAGLDVPCHHIFMAADPYWYNPLDGARTRWDLSFIGTPYENRLSLLESILRELPPGLPLRGRLVGNCRSYFHPFRAAREMSPYPLTAMHLKHGANWTHSQINVLNNESRICINVMHPQSNDSLNPRTFETCASGAFLLCQTNNALARCFEPGKEVETFASPGEAAEKISFYLGNPSAAQAIAEAGKRRVLRDHTMGVRIGQALQALRDDSLL